MKRTLTIFTLLVALFAASIGAQAQDQAIQRGLDAVTTSAIKAHVNFLASPLLEGRYPTQRGGALAAEYIAAAFTQYGIQPAGDVADGKKTYFQNFDIVRYSQPFDWQFSIDAGQGSILPTPNIDFSIANRRLSNGFSLSDNVVFVGYGLSLPEYGIDSYGKLDVKGKIVVVLPVGKEDLAAFSHFKGLSNEKQEAILASQEAEISKRKPAAVIFLRNAKDLMGKMPNAKPTIFFEDNLSLPSNHFKSPTIRVNLNKGLVYQDFKQHGLDINTVDFKFKGVKLPIIISMSAKIKGTPLRDRNVLGMIAGEDTTKCIIVGAHYDHHGTWNGVVYPGADDNASGTAGVIMLAKALKESGIKPKVNVIFALWTAEEKGLVGSTFYARNPIIPLSQTAMYVNYDMIGRNAVDDTARVRAHFFYLDRQPVIKEIVERNNKRLGNILLLTNAATEGGYWSDHGPFYERGVVFMGWAAGNHPDYHKPTDTPDKIDPEKIQKIVRLSFLNMLDFANGQ